MKKAVAAILLFIVLLNIFACSDGGSSSTSSNTQTNANGNGEIELTDDNTFYGLEKADFEGRTFNILYRDDVDYSADNSIYVEVESGDIVDSAVYNRNRNVEETFNVEINAIAMNGGWSVKDSFSSTVINSVYANDGAYDLIDYYAAYICDAISANVLLNLNEVNHLQLTSPWWSQIAAEALTVNGKLYTIPGDLSLSLWSHILTVFFNKTVAENYNIENLYDLVNDGKWTVDKFVEISKTIYIDIDGNGAYDTNDAYGTVLTDDLQFNNFHYAMNIPITKKDSEGFIEYNLDSAEVTNMITFLYSMIYETNGIAYFHDKAADAEIMFQDNRVLFMPTLLGNAEKLRNMDSDFGIIPYPKGSESQTYYGTTSRDQHTLFCIPIDVKDSDFAGYITEALCVASYYEVVPVYYDIALKDKYSRDNDSAEMLDLIREGLSFDFAAVYSMSLERAGFFTRDILYQKKTDIASFYETYIAKFNGALETFMECFK